MAAMGALSTVNSKSLHGVALISSELPSRPQTILKLPQFLLLRLQVTSLVRQHEDYTGNQRPRDPPVVLECRFCGHRSPHNPRL